MFISVQKRSRNRVLTLILLMAATISTLLLGLGTSRVPIYWEDGRERTRDRETVNIRMNKWKRERVMRSPPMVGWALGHPGCRYTGRMDEKQREIERLLILG